MHQFLPQPFLLYAGVPAHGLLYADVSAFPESLDQVWLSGPDKASLLRKNQICLPCDDGFRQKCHHMIDTLYPNDEHLARKPSPCTFPTDLADYPLP